ncbi:MAG TPA: hypothetical protein DIS66_02080 [Candidatus Omnitrophica bacterium]|nr:hypothetical protein [Candidatus Omnitrophota bacterium]
MISILTAVLFILALEAVLVVLSTHPRTKKFFSVLPAIFWMYFLPGVFTWAGWLHVPVELSQFSSTWLMPLALILLVAPANVSKLLHMGRQSFMTLMAVYASMLLAGVGAFFVFKSFLAMDAWKAFAALGATWTGGTVNMLAVKEIVGLSESQFSVMVITDAFLSYGWMVLLILFYRWQHHFNRWAGSVAHDAEHESIHEKNSFFLKRDWVWILLAIVLVGIAHGIGSRMPVHESFPQKAWILLAASLLAVASAVAGWHKLVQSRFADHSGSWLLYFVLMTMRAQADFIPKSQDLIIIVAGLVWLFLHGGLMAGYAKLFRVRLSVLAVASQAAVGGVVSAPVLAALYDKSLVSVAVLMGIFGNLVGTYLGLLLGQIVRALH